MRTYFRLDDYPSYSARDIGFNHANAIYSNSALETGRLNSFGDVSWAADSNFKLCQQNEVYDSDSKLCYREKRALTFLQGKTTAIDIKSDVIEQNFTVEMWVKLIKSSDTYQLIITNQFFNIRYENTQQYSLIMMNSTIAGDPTFKSVSSVISPLNAWTHIAISNSEAVKKSCIYVNGTETGKNSFVLIPGAFTTYKLSDSVKGFNGFLREYRVWNEFRSASLIEYSMHHYQWYAEGNLPNLYAYFRLDEGRGVALKDSYNAKPNNVRTFDLSSTTLIPPFWTSTEDLPVICGFSHIYDRNQNACRVTKKVLRIDGATNFSVNYMSGFRDWTLKAFIKLRNFPVATEDSVIYVANMVDIKVRSPGNLNVYAKTDDGVWNQVSSNTSLNTTTWYYISVGFSYGYMKVTSELREAVNITTNLIANLTSNCTYSGPTYIILNNSYFMHVSLWKKYAPTAIPGVNSMTEMQDPYFRLNLIYF